MMTITSLEEESLLPLELIRQIAWYLSPYEVSLLGRVSTAWARKIGQGLLGGNYGRSLALQHLSHYWCQQSAATTADPTTQTLATNSTDAVEPGRIIMGWDWSIMHKTYWIATICKLPLSGYLLCRIFQLKSPHPNALSFAFHKFCKESKDELALLLRNAVDLGTQFGIDPSRDQFVGGTNLSSILGLMADCQLADSLDTALKSNGFYGLIWSEVCIHAYHAQCAELVALAMDHDPKAILGRDNYLIADACRENDLAMLKAVLDLFPITRTIPTSLVRLVPAQMEGGRVDVVKCLLETLSESEDPLSLERGVNISLDIALKHTHLSFIKYLVTTFPLVPTFMDLVVSALNDTSNYPKWFREDLLTLINDYNMTFTPDILEPILKLNNPDFTRQWFERPDVIAFLFDAEASHTLLPQLINRLAAEVSETSYDLFHRLSLLPGFAEISPSDLSESLKLAATSGNLAMTIELASLPAIDIVPAITVAIQNSHVDVLNHLLPDTCASTRTSSLPTLNFTGANGEDLAAAVGSHLENGLEYLNSLCTRGFLAVNDTNGLATLRAACRAGNSSLAMHLLEFTPFDDVMTDGRDMFEIACVGVTAGHAEIVRSILGRAEWVSQGLFVDSNALIEACTMGNRLVALALLESDVAEGLVLEKMEGVVTASCESGDLVVLKAVLAVIERAGEKVDKGKVFRVIEVCGIEADKAEKDEIVEVISTWWEAYGNVDLN